MSPLCFLLVVCANFIIKVENKSFFGIGTRIIDDQLLLKDVLRTPPMSLTEEPVIKFNYAIVEPITYIEIESDKNVFANVKFSYEDNLVEGTISYMNDHQVAFEPFEVLIHIYGLNKTMLSVSPAYILNKDQQFTGVLQPNDQRQKQHHRSLLEENLNPSDLDELEDYEDEMDAYDTDNKSYEDDFNDYYDKVIEQGERQEGDFLVYETNQTSAITTESPTNHSLTFYYIDIYYITCVKFTIYEHYLYHSTDENGDTYVVEYGQISPTSLKAVVTDHRTTSLFVQMQMYGYHPTVLPVDYKPFLSNSQTLASASASASPSLPTTRPMSSLTKLKILMNAQQENSQHQQMQTIEDLQKQPKELGHQMNPNNNCMQQVLSSASASASNVGNDSLSIFTHWFIFNLIFGILIVTMIST